MVNAMYRILIVEDDESIARSVKTHLESWNYEVCCAEDFSNVAGTFAAFDPQLVLMDVKLPFSMATTGAVRSVKYQKCLLFLYRPRRII